MYPRNFSAASLLRDTYLEFPLDSYENRDPWERSFLSVPQSLGVEYLEMLSFEKYHSPPRHIINNYWMIHRYFLGWEPTTKTLVYSTGWSCKGETWYNTSDFILVCGREITKKKH